MNISRLAESQKEKEEKGKEKEKNEPYQSKRGAFSSTSGINLMICLEEKGTLGKAPRILL